MKAKRGRKIAKWIAIAVIVIIGAVAGLAYWAWQEALAGYHGEAAWVHIATDSDDKQVEDSLRSALGYEFGEKVAKLWRLQRRSAKIASGAYRITTGDNAMAVSRRLLHGMQTPVKVTFNNIRTLGQLASRVSSYLEIDSAAFLAACDSILPAQGFAKAEYPAAFVPDSYEFYWNASAPTVVKRLLDYRNQLWSDDRRARAKAQGLTPAEVATIASIVEEETGKKDERPVVARLYMNRLKKGMLLQADPTVKFAIGDFGLRRILNRHLEVESPYNTYKHAGLPPGPIRIPTAATIDAVLDAPQHNYLYMCAKEDFSGYHNFATDYGAHMQNARKYQNALNRKGIK